MASNPFLGGFAGDSPFGVPRGSRPQLRAPGVVSPAQPVNPALGMGRGIGGLQAGLDAFRNWRSQRPGGPGGVGGAEAAPGGFPPPGGVAQGLSAAGQTPQPTAPTETPRQRAERQAQQKAKRAGGKAKQITAPAGRQLPTPPTRQPIRPGTPGKPGDFMLNDQDVYGTFGAGYGG